MEYLDIVDEKDAILKPHVEYEDVHAAKAIHRAVHVILLNDTDELLIQLRSENKKAFPLHWTFSAGGHVRHGETYEQAIGREVKEELELTIPEDQFILKGEGTFTDENGHAVYYHTFMVRYNGPIEVKENEEVAAVQFVTWETLKSMIQDPHEKIHSEFIEVVERHWGEFL